MKVLVIGSGAVGSFYGAKLAQKISNSDDGFSEDKGAQVSFLCRSDYEVVKRCGFEIKSYLGDFHFKPFAVLCDIKEYKEKPDYILIATKVLPDFSAVEIAHLIAPIISSHTKIVLLQNGIHIEQPIKKQFPKHKIISAIAFVCVSRLQSGLIFHQDFGKLIIGNFPSGIDEDTKNLAAMWRISGIEVVESEKIQEERWKKLVWNAAFNPISVLKNGLNTQQIIANSLTKQLAKNVMFEVCALAKSDGFELPENFAEKTIEITEQMKPYKTSMLLDFEAKRKMEIEAILGNAVRFAKTQSIDVPYLSSLYALLSSY